MKKTKLSLIAATMAISCAAVAMPAFADALSFDTDHDVFVLPENELTVRYNNKTFAPVRVVRTDKVEPHFLTRPVLVGPTAARRAVRVPGAGRSRASRVRRRTRRSGRSRWR